MTPIDDLVTPSITKENPLYQAANIFKPTSKKEIIVGMVFKIISIGLMALGSTLLAMVAVVADLSHTLLISGIVLNILGLVGGALGEAIILFTKEEPLSSLVRAAEDIKLTAVTEAMEAPLSTDSTPPSDPTEFSRS